MLHEATSENMLPHFAEPRRINHLLAIADFSNALAIDPITWGYGFAILDGPQDLIDWDLQGTSRREEPRERWCLRQIGVLIDRYGPDRIVVEDCLDARSRRGKRSRTAAPNATCRAAR